MNEEVMQIVNGMVAKAYAAGYTAGRAHRVNWTPAPVLICLVLLALVVL